MDIQYNILPIFAKKILNNNHYKAKNLMNVFSNIKIGDVSIIFKRKNKELIGKGEKILK